MSMGPYLFTVEETSATASQPGIMKRHTANRPEQQAWQSLSKCTEPDPGFINSIPRIVTHDQG